MKTLNKVIEEIYRPNPDDPDNPEVKFFDKHVIKQFGVKDGKDYAGNSVDGPPYKAGKIKIQDFARHGYKPATGKDEAVYEAFVMACDDVLMESGIDYLDLDEATLAKKISRMMGGKSSAKALRLKTRQNLKDIGDGKKTATKERVADLAKRLIRIGNIQHGPENAYAYDYLSMGLSPKTKTSLRTKYPSHLRKKGYMMGEDAREREIKKFEADQDEKGGMKTSKEWKKEWKKRNLKKTVNESVQNKHSQNHHAKHVKRALEALEGIEDHLEKHKEYMDMASKSDEHNVYHPHHEMKNLARELEDLKERVTGKFMIKDNPEHKIPVSKPDPNYKPKKYIRGIKNDYDSIY